MQYRERKIRVRAHQIWEEEDCPDGRDLEHWERAAREVDADPGEASVAEKTDTAEPLSGSVDAKGQAAPGFFQKQAAE